MKKGVFTLTLIALAIVSCAEISGSSASSISSYTPGVNECVIRFETILFTDENYETFEISKITPYHDYYFDASGKVFNKELALVSFASYAASTEKETADAFFASIGFDNVYHSPDFDVPETVDTVKYNFAHKKIGEYDLIAISMSALYAKPWVSNVTVGKTGNAQGFQDGANKVLAALRTYMDGYKNNKIKIWLTGHSRTAAIANLMAETLLDEENPLFTDDTVFCYGFEAPTCLDVNLKKEHASIHNIINKEDIVQAIYPSCYGLTRAGHDIDITNENVDKLVNDFDPRSHLTPSNSIEGMPKGKDFVNFLVAELTRPVSSEDEEYGYAPDLATREHYVDNGYQEYLATMFQTMFGIKAKNFLDFVERIMELGVGAVSLIADDVAYELFSEVLDANHETYDKDKLKAAFNGLIRMLRTNCLSIMLTMVMPDTINDYVRAVQNHGLEVILPCLLAYNG